MRELAGGPTRLERAQQLERRLEEAEGLLDTHERTAFAVRRFAWTWAWEEIGPEPPADTTPDHLRIRLTKEPALGPEPTWLAWAALLWRVFREDKISCPRCGKPMRVPALTP
ncbi:MAG TPA: hypothetical protein QGF58_11625 [Myxococcota bacterium]|nr:hypothetical protein [Myxococcota bacterium]